MPVTRPIKSTNGNTRTMCEIRSNLTIRSATTTSLTHLFDVSIANFEQENGSFDEISKQYQFSSF